MTAKIKTMDCSVDGNFGSIFIFTTEIGQVRLTWEQGVTSIGREPADHVGLYMAEVNGKSVYEDMEPIEEPDLYNDTFLNPDVLEKTGLSEEDYLACRELAESALKRFLQEEA